MIKKWWRTSSPQLRQGLFPASEKKKKDRLEVVIRWCSRHMWSPLSAKACTDWGRSALLLAANFYQRSQLFNDSNKQTPPQINTFILNWHSQIPVAFSCYLSPHYSACKKRPCEFENRFRKTRTARPKKNDLKWSVIPLNTTIII